MKKIIVGGTIIGAIAVVIAFSFVGKGKTKLNLHTAAIGMETVEIDVTATGYVQPVDKVELGTQVSGVIEKIHVDYNSRVTKGQLLAELDKSTLTETVSQREASVVSAESDLTYAQQNYDRVKQLYDAKAATQTAYEEAVNRLAQAKTSLVNAKANLHHARVNLSYAEIYAPIDGVVLDRAVEQGQTVAASFSTPTLFTIANDLKNMKVEASVDEADIGRVRVGQKVIFTVDAYPGNVFDGSVKQVRLQPTVTSNVVTYTVIIDAPNPEEKLFPGMTASVTIITHSEGGIAVPVEALQFNPSPEIGSKISVIPKENANASDKGVWVKTKQGIMWTGLETGLSDGVYAIVTSGLNVGDTVVLSAVVEKVSRNKEATSIFPPGPGGRRPPPGGM